MKVKLQLMAFFSMVFLGYSGMLNAQTNLLQAGNMESETGWSVSMLNTAAEVEPTVTWNYTTDTPAAGQGGALHLTGTTTSGNSQVCFYQAVDLEAGKTYTFDGAFKEIQINNSWCEVFLGEMPADGSDYGTDNGTLLCGLGTWATPLQLDGEFSKHTNPYNAFVPETSGTYYFVLKAGSTSWDGSTQTFEIIIDELSLTDRAKPIVKFSSSTTTGFTGDPVQFTDASIYADSWSWDFGDGSAASTDQNPSHTYDAAGTYTVALTATNELGENTLAKTDLITIEEPPVEVTAGGSIKGGEMESDSEWSTSLLNTPAGNEPVVTWNNTADNAPAAGTGGNLHVTGTTTSGNSQYCIYQAVELSADSVYWFDGAFNLIQVNNTWVEVFIGEQPIDGLDYRAEDGFDLQLLAGAGTWAGPDKNNGTFAIDANPYNVFIPDTSGTYYFVMKMGSTSWDGSTQTFEMVVDELSLTASREKPYTAFSSPNPLGFAPLTVDFVNNTKFAVSYSWDFGDGSAVSTEENPTHVYETAGTYTVVLTATNEKGDSTVTKTDFVKANEKPALPAGEKLYGGNMEDPNLWNITNLNADIMPTAATWNYTDASAAHGAGGGLYVSGSVSNGTTHYCIWQTVELNADSVYRFNGAFRALTELNQFWTEVFIGTVPPEDGEDYGADSIKISQFNTWASCTGSLVDGTFKDDGCEIVADYQPETTGTYYFVVKIGSGEWTGGETYNFEVIVDELTLQESTFAPAAVANFFSDVTEGDAPLTVFFTDLSENASAWAWDFGDGQTSTDQHPSHTYTDPGTYTVTLIASNEANADTMEVVDLITVNEVISVTSFNAAALNVYPNPSNGQVKVEVPAGMRGTLVITDVAGKEVMKREIYGSESTVQVGIEAPGMYLFRMQTEQNAYYSKVVVR